MEGAVVVAWVLLAVHCRTSTTAKAASFTAPLTIHFTSSLSTTSHTYTHSRLHLHTTSDRLPFPPCPTTTRLHRRIPVSAQHPGLFRPNLTPPPTRPRPSSLLTPPTLSPTHPLSHSTPSPYPPSPCLRTQSRLYRSSSSFSVSLTCTIVVTRSLTVPRSTSLHSCTPRFPHTPFTHLHSCLDRPTSLRTVHSRSTRDLFSLAGYPESPRPRRASPRRSFRVIGDLSNCLLPHSPPSHTSALRYALFIRFQCYRRGRRRKVVARPALRSE